MIQKLMGIHSEQTAAQMIKIMRKADLQNPASTVSLLCCSRAGNKSKLRARRAWCG